MKFKKKYLYLIIIVIVIIAALHYLYKASKSIQTPAKDLKKDLNVEWQIDGNGYLHYPLERGEVKFSRETMNQTDNLLISKIVYESRNGNIYGLLVLPTSAAKLLPGVVLLPGAGVSKESEIKLAMKIAELDAAVLVIDQRGVGETGGKFPALDEDYASYLAGKEPYQHL